MPGNPSFWQIQHDLLITEFIMMTQNLTLSMHRFFSTNYFLFSYHKTTVVVPQFEIIQVEVGSILIVTFKILWYVDIVTSTW